MRYRLALDLGTSSIGLVAYALDANDEPFDIPYHTVRIFQEPLNPGKGVGEPKKAARREARQMRKQLERKASRHRRIAHCLCLLDLLPENILPDKGQTIHHLRAEAACGRIELEDFARVLLKMSKRRGYAGGFKADKDKTEAEATGKKPARQAKLPKSDKDKDDDNAVVKPGIEKLKAAMAECHAQTLGQYLSHRYDLRLSLKLAPADAEEKLYAHRDMLEEEFEQIWTTQAAFHAVLNESRPDPQNPEEIRPIKDIFHDALLFQRPLKSPAAMVGGCPLEKGLPRAPMAQPAAQAFRIEKQLADLRWGMGRRASPLLAEQKAVIRELLRNQEKVAFPTIYKALEKAGCPRPPGRGLNMDRASREELSGDKTRAVLRSQKINLLAEWDALDGLTQIQIINFLADLGSPEQLYADNWPAQFVKKVRAGKNTQGKWLHKFQPRQFSPDFTGFIDLLKNREGYGRLAAMGFDPGRSAYSVKALGKLTETLRELEGGLEEEENNHERAAIEKAYPDHYAEKPTLTELPPPPLTGNTVVDVALREVEREIREAMKELGGLPEEIYIELARAMAQGVSRRNEIEAENANKRKQRKAIEAKLEESGYRPNKTKVNKYLLWEEQDRFCPYCGDLIELNEVVDGQQTNIEHILPRSLTRIGGRRDQLVLAHRLCNDLKTDQTPWDAWGGEPPKDKARWDAVVAQAQRFRAKKLRGRAILMGKARLLELRDWADDETVQGFSDRQFQETAWIAKHTAQWLRSICPPGKVQVSRGEMTAHLRRIWHLETVIPQVRFEEKLPVFDTDGGRVSREDFDHHRAFWEGRGKDEGANRTDRRIEKRIDHRHHLIDALVIGLCTPRLYQKMATEYKQRAGRREHGEGVKLTLNIAPPLHDPRQRALELVRECKLTHKPDRFPDGPLFKETAYGVAEVAADGKTRWHLKPEELQAEAKPADTQRRLTIRVKLKDFAGDKDSAETVRKKLGDIASPEVRKLVTDAYDCRIAKGDTPQQALATPVTHPQYATPIKAAKVFVGNKPGQYLDADDAQPIIHQSRQGSHYKLLQHEGNACLDVWADGNGVKTRLLKPVEAMREKGRNPPNRFYKNDTVLDTRDGKRYLIRQIKAQSGGMLVMTPITEAREVRDMSAEEGLLTASGKALLKLRRL